MQPSHVKHQTAPLARAIAERALALKVDGVPQDVWDYLKLCLADAVGIAFASRHYDFAAKSLQSLDVLGSKGSASIIGQAGTVALRDAALMNGLLIHGLDYDDTHLASVMHCSASALPATLALAEHQQLDGRSLLLATLIAIEIDALLGTQAGGGIPTGRLSSHGCGGDFWGDCGSGQIAGRR